MARGRTIVSDPSWPGSGEIPRCTMLGNRFDAKRCWISGSGERRRSRRIRSGPVRFDRARGLEIGASSRVLLFGTESAGDHLAAIKAFWRGDQRKSPRTGHPDVESWQCFGSIVACAEPPRAETNLILSAFAPVVHV